MRPVVVLVNGVPAAGKTTLARALSVELGLPLLSKDVIKETLFDWIGTGDREWSMKLGAASSVAIWALLCDCPRGAILEQPFGGGRAYVPGHLARAGIEDHYEIWCDIDPALAHERFVRRAPTRHPGHLSMQEIDTGGAQVAAEPLGLGEVLRVRTDEPVDIVAVANWIRCH